MKSEILENETISSNSKQVAILKQHFPACFDKNGRFLPDKMAQIADAEGLDITHEGYSLNWLGKSYARLLANLNTETLLSANAEHNEKPENANSQNLLIQGDNLDVLKHLTNAYSEQIKMIYIDPPYNTGSDGFVYRDDRKFTPTQLAQLAGIEEAEAERILAFTQSNSNSHSAWLTFMYPRLYVARELLREDGVIFISIDDNEQAQLKMLCDEVFGEENFVSMLVWEKKRKGTFLSNSISSVKEYILVYASNAQFFQGLIGQINEETTTYPCVNASNGREMRTIPKGIKSKFREPDHFLPKGTKISAGSMDLVLHSDLRIEGSVLAEELVIEGNWRYTQDNMSGYAADDELYITQDLYLRRIVSEPREKTLKDLLPRVGDDDDAQKPIDPADLFADGWGSNEEGEEALRLLMGVKGLMSFPKPTKLISKLVASVVDKDATVLDFFVGSGTTAQSVMDLNALDGGSRRYLCVQLDEKTDPESEAHKAGYKTIFEITRERIIRASKKIQKDNPNVEGDFGFKEFKTVPVFDGYLDEADTPEQYTIFEGDKLSEEQRAQLLLTWQVYDGMPINLTLNSVDLNGYSASMGGHILYCINASLQLSHIVAMLEGIDSDPDFAPTKLVIFEYILSSKAKREITEAIKHYTNKKQLELHLEIRF